MIRETDTNTANNIIVIKCGGAAMTDEVTLQKLLQDIAFIKRSGVQPVIIHGGGPDISNLCKRLHIPVQFVNGQRVTDAATLEVAQMVLCGKTNRSIVAHFNLLAIKAVGISGHDAGFIKAQRYAGETGEMLGFVGKITAVDCTLIQQLLAENYLPVISPLACDEQGQTYNINADIAAGAVAAALAKNNNAGNVTKIVFLTDVDGWYADLNDVNSRIKLVKTSTIEKHFNDGTITGGMVPKLQASLHAIYQGVSTAHIINGNVPHSLLQLMKNEDVGTLITA